MRPVILLVQQRPLIQKHNFAVDPSARTGSPTKKCVLR